MCDQEEMEALCVRSLDLVDLCPELMAAYPRDERLINQNGLLLRSGEDHEEGQRHAWRDLHRTFNMKVPDGEAPDAAFSRAFFVMRVERALDGDSRRSLSVSGEGTHGRIVRQTPRAGYSPLVMPRSPLVGGLPSDQLPKIEERPDSV